MVAALAIDLRKRVLQAWDVGGRITAAAERCAVRASFVRKVQQR
jgi:hypothetical protein